MTKELQVKRIEGTTDRFAIMAPYVSPDKDENGNEVTLYRSVLVSISGLDVGIARLQKGLAQALAQRKAIDDFVAAEEATAKVAVPD